MGLNEQSEPDGGRTLRMDELIRYADELREWARIVHDAAGALGSAVPALLDVWADAAGREWTERLRLVGAELARQADDAEDLAGHTERSAHTPDVGVPLGVRLGGQSGARATDRRGVVIPVLPPP